MSVSYRFIQTLAERCRVGRGDLAAHGVGVAAAAAGSSGAVVATLAHSEAKLGRRIAAQAGQAERQDGHGAPAGAGMSRGTGAGSVSAVVLIISRTVVKETLHTAQAGAILYGVLGRAQTSLATRPARGQASRGTALLALAAATAFTDEQM